MKPSDGTKLLIITGALRGCLQRSALADFEETLRQYDQAWKTWRWMNQIAAGEGDLPLQSIPRN